MKRALSIRIRCLDSRFRIAVRAVLRYEADMKRTPAIRLCLPALGAFSGYAALALAFATGTGACKSEARKFELTVPSGTGSVAPFPVVASAPPLTSSGLEGPMPPGHPPIGGGPVGGAPVGGGSEGATPLPSAGGVAAGTAASSDTVLWEVPARWKSLPSASSMRKATYGIPHAAGDDADAELTVIQAGGELQANIDRWAGQFEENPKPVRTERTLNGLKVIVVELQGTYKGGGMGGADTKRPNSTMLAAVVMAPEMPYFFKMTGSRATVAAAKPEFEKFLQSIRKR
jgi:hypothetical protein